jgi:ABC-type multidrug transport system fused ATPase/permease subunit
MSTNEIHEEDDYAGRPLLINHSTNMDDPRKSKRTTTDLPRLAKKDSMGATELKPRRAESLATRGDIDFMALINDAKKNCKVPIKLSFRDVCFEVDEKLTAAEKAKMPGQEIKKKMIVNHATGVALPGQTTFIMGASGAGKTSLLNILADRISMRGNA